MDNSQGQDKFCGCKLSYSTKATHLCRYCDCPVHETDNTAFKFHYRQQRQIEKLLNKNDSKALESLGFLI